MTEKTTEALHKLTVYELIDKDGNRTGHVSTEAFRLGMLATRLWPDQEQDETRSGLGWDVEAVRTL